MSKDIIFAPNAWEEFLEWQVENKQIFKKINELIKDIVRNPFEGLGKPEPLKHELADYWSRRIDKEHRIVYLVGEDYIKIMRCKRHYE